MVIEKDKSSQDFVFVVLIFLCERGQWLVAWTRVPRNRVLNTYREIFFGFTEIQSV